MRAADISGVLVYCTDYRCSHSVALAADRWADDFAAVRHRSALYLQRLRPTRRRRSAGLAHGRFAIPKAQPILELKEATD
jgi:hypothetical protein